MERDPATHGGVFDDEAFARDYARKHWKMAADFGERYGRKLKKNGFVRGRVLDVGCGSGATNLTLADQFPDSEFVGIDLSDPLLEMAREKARQRGVAQRVRFEKADVLDIPFEDDFCDVLINLNMVHLVGDPLRMFAEMERVLTPTGFLFVADLRRSFLGIVEREIRSGLFAREAKGLIRDSNLRAGLFSSGVIWWRYESVPQD
jgi:ubiquinone/menaquinone biosynthesis C-methylase UbiE